MATRPDNLPANVPRRVVLDPAGTPSLRMPLRLWNPDAPLESRPVAKVKAAPEKRAGGGQVSQARLDVEEDIEKAVEAAFTIARDRLMRRVEGSGE